LVRQTRHLNESAPGSTSTAGALSPRKETWTGCFPVQPHDPPSSGMCAIRDQEADLGVIAPAGGLADSPAQVRNPA
jgi:hypothetical protein